MNPTTYGKEITDLQPKVPFVTVGGKNYEAPPPPPPPPATNTSTPVRTPSLLEQKEAERIATISSREDIRRKTDLEAAVLRNARIDAINTTFAPRISRAKEEGEKNLSRVAALNFRTGTIGSGVDATRSGEQRDLNEKEVRAIEDQKAMAISEAFGWADKIAKERADEIYNDAKDAATANVTRYKERADTAMKALDVFGAQNVTAEQLKIADPKTYETLRDVSGMSDGQIDAYLKTKAPEGTYKWDQARTEGNKMYVPKIDPITKKISLETVELGFTPKPGFKSTASLGDGRVAMFFDDGTYKVIGEGPGGGGSSSATSFDDIMQQSIDLGATAEQAAREAALASEQAGVQVDQKTLKSWTERARTMSKTPAPTAEESVPAATSEIEKEIADLGRYGILQPGDIRHSLKKRGYTQDEINASSIANPIDKATSFFANLFGV